MTQFALVKLMNGARSKNLRRILLTVTAFLGGMAICNAEPLAKGVSKFTLANLGEPIEVFAYKPPTYTKGPILVVVHGTGRNADEYRDYAINIAERYDCIIVAPLFDEVRFTDDRYKRGGGVMKDGKLQPKDKWSFNIIFRLVAEVQKMEGKPQLPYYVIGHSGGAQIVTKMAMFMPGDARGFMAANPGSNVFPDKTIPFPYGLGGLPDELSNDEILRQYCAVPLTFLLGSNDVYQNASDGFDFSENAMKQGPVRMARNHNFYNMMQKLAASHGWKFNWRIMETPGIGHSGSRMFHAPEIGDAIFGSEQTVSSKR